MPWLCVLPDHQQPSYWMSEIDRTLSSTTKDFTTYAISVLKTENTNIFMFPGINLERWEPYSSSYVSFQDKGPSGGRRLASLANFFHNLGPGRRAKSTDSAAGHTSNEMTPHQPSPGPPPPTKLALPESSRPGSATSITTLPHIPLESKGRLTVDAPITPNSPMSPRANQRFRLPSHEEDSPFERGGDGSRPSSGRRKRPMSGQNNQSTSKQSYSNNDKRTSNRPRSTSSIYPKTAEQLR